MLSRWRGYGLIIVIVVGVGLLIYAQRNNNFIEAVKIASTPLNITVTKSEEKADEKSLAHLNTTVNEVKSKTNYLDPVYEVSVQKDIVYANKQNESLVVEPLKFDLYESSIDKLQLRPVFIFIHGGGYREGDKADTVAISEELTKRGYAVLAINYRLKQNSTADFSKTFSDASKDVADVIEWINKNGKSYRLDTAQIAIGGDSAGGHLAMNFMNEYSRLNPINAKQIFAIVDIFGGSLMSNVHKDFPPMLIIHGTADNIVPYQESVLLNKSLTKNNIYHDFLTMKAVGHNYRNLKYWDEVVDTVSYFLSNAMKHLETQWLPEITGFQALPGDPIMINVPKAYNQDENNKNFKIEIPNGWTLGKKQSGKSLNVQIPFGVNPGSYSIFVYLDKENETAPSYAIHVRVNYPLVVQFQNFFDEADKKVKTRLQITNQSQIDFSGSIKLDYETVNSTKETFQANVELIKSGKLETLTIPELLNGKRIITFYNTSGKVQEQIEDLASINVLMIHKQENPIQIDGKLDEWKDQAHFEVNEIKIPDWKGKLDISAAGYSSWDQTNLYIALEVNDDKHIQGEQGASIWNGDSVQFAIGLTNADGSNPEEYHEMGVSLNQENQISKWRWIAPKGFSTEGKVKLDQAILRKDQKTYYEIAIPWSELTKHLNLVKNGLKMKFSLLINDNDSNKRRGYLEYNSGIGAEKDLNIFGDLFLN